MALAAYRNLLRSARIAFQGDTYRLNAAQLQARKQFNDNRDLEARGEKALAAIEHAEAVAKVLRENIVQGKETGENGHFKLRIHEHTQRGSNDTIKLAAGKKDTTSALKSSGNNMN